MITSQWREFVGAQLNALVAILALAVIAVVGMITGSGEQVTIPCVTGIAGIAGTLQRTPPAATRTTDHSSSG